MSLLIHSRMHLQTIGDEVLRKYNPSAVSSRKYRGVRPAGTKFRMEFKHLEKYTSRTFSNQEEAARAYDKLAITHHGQHAKLNFAGNRVCSSCASARL